MSDTQQQDGQATAVEKWAQAGIPQEMAAEAAVMVASGFFRDVKTTAQALVKIMAGREWGFPAFLAMKYIHIFETKGGPQMQLGYPLVAALVNRSPHYRYEVQAHDKAQCRIAFYRGDKLLGVSAITIEEAKAAGLTNRDVWTFYPKTMLFARALTTGVKWYCPEILGGADVSEEPYIEGTARVVEEAENGAPEEVHAPPEGYTPPWKRFWAVAKGDPETGGLGMTEDEVHDHFGVPRGAGELKAAAERKAKNEGKTVAQVVAEMEMLLRESREPKSEEGREATDAEWASLAETAEAEVPAEAFTESRQ